MNKKLVLALVVALATVPLVAAEMVEGIVARVGDRIITRTQYARRLRDGLSEIEKSSPPDQVAARKDEFRKALMNDLLSDLLLKDRADRLGISVSQAEVTEAIKRLKDQYGITTDAQFAESLQSSGMTRVDMEARLRDTILTNKVFSKELKPREELTDRELREKYDREKDKYRLPERAHLREIILVKPSDSAGAAAVQQKAEALAAEARSGADFATLATANSQVSTKDKGGDMGEVARGELLPDLDKAVFNSAPGTVVGPIATKSGYHILRIEQRLPSEVPAFESVKEKLRKDVSDDTFQRDYKSYVERLRKDAFIQINEANIPTV
jgi:parvulin-like peptidyl-prolyl isomerase